MTQTGDTRRPLGVDIVLLSLSFVIFVTLIGLGNWQMRRLDWKLSLIEAVEARAFGAPQAAPNRTVSADDDAYLRVQATGTFRHDLSLRVKAVTEMGGGHWLLTPFETPSQTIWINRGFVPTGVVSGGVKRPDGEQTVTGLLRITEPDGTALEANQPDTGRWVSRDVAAMSQATGVGGTADYFIDAEHAGAPGDWPRGGMTIVSFRNNHLSYALTWYALAALFAFGMAYVIWDRMRGGADDAAPLTSGMEQR